MFRVGSASARRRALAGISTVVVSATVLVTVPLQPAAAAAAGDIDTTYAGGDGIVAADFAGLDRAHEAVVDGAGRTIIVGSSSDNNGETTVVERAAIARVTSEGTLDPTFGGPFAGRAEAPAPALTASDSNRLTDVAIDSIGRIVAVGTANDLPNDNTSERRAFVARFTPTGDLDTTLDGDGVVPIDVDPAASYEHVTSVLVEPGTDAIYIAGSVGAPSSALEHPFIARLDAEGSPDPTFGSGGFVVETDAGSYEDAAFSTDGRIVAVGRLRLIETTGEPDDTLLARYTPIGDIDFGPQGFDIEDGAPAQGADTAASIAVQADGQVVIAGTVDQAGTPSAYVARFTWPALALDTGGFFAPFGSRTTSFSGGTARGIGVAIAPDGRVLVAGTATDGIRHDLAIARYLADGAADPSFGAGRIDTSTNLAGDGDLVLDDVGRPIVIGSHIHLVAARFVSEPAQGTDPGSVDLSFAPDPDPSDAGDVVVLAGGTPLAVGSTGASLRLSRYTTVGIDGSFGTGGHAVIPVAGATTVSVNTAVLQPDGRVVIAGSQSNGTSSDAFVARLTSSLTPDPTFDGDGFKAVNIIGDEEGFDAAVLPDGRVVVVGSATSGNPSFAFVTRLLADGAIDSTFGSSGTEWIAGGSVTAVARGVAVDEAGNVFVAGDVDDSGTSASLFIRKYDISGAPDPSFGVDGHFSHSEAFTAALRINDIALDAEGRAVLGGDRFICDGGSGSSPVWARVTAAGVLDPTFSSDGIINDSTCPSHFVDTIEEIVIQPNGRIVGVGMTALDVGGSAFVPSAYRLEPNGAPDHSFRVGGYAILGSADGDARAVALLPDGRIAVASDGGAGSQVSVLLGDPLPELPTYAPSGIIAYSSDRTGESELWVTQPDGSAPARITPDTLQPGRNWTDPMFNPGATRLVASSAAVSNPFDADIVRLNADGTALTPLANTVAFEADPAWSNDDRIAYSNDMGGALFDIWVMNPDGSGKTNFTASPSTWDTWASWSPDSQWITFMRGPSGGGPFQIWKKQVGGAGTEVQLTSVGSNTRPAFSPDGSKIAFTSNRDGNGEIYVMNADGSGQTRVTAFAGNDDGAAFSPDGTHLVFERDGQLFTALLVGGPAQQLTTPPGMSGGPSWIDNLTLVASAASTPSSPSEVPTWFVPTQPLAKTIVDSAPLPGLGLIRTPLPGLGLIRTPLPGLGLIRTPLPGLGLIRTPLPGLGLIRTPLPGLGLIRTPLPGLGLIRTPVADGLRRMPLSSLGLLRPGGWDAYVAGSHLDGRPVATLTLYDVLDDSFLAWQHGINTDPDPNNDRPYFTLGELDYADSPFGELSPLSLILIGSPIRAMHTIPTASWCSMLERQDGPWAGVNDVDDCGAPFGGLDASLVDLQVAGVDLADVEEQIDSLNVGDIDLDLGVPAASQGDDEPHAALRDFLLSDVEMRTMDIGSIKITELTNPSAVVTCDANGCPSGTLTDAQQANRVRSDASIGSLRPAINRLSLKSLVLGLLPPTQQPHDQLALDELGVGGYDDGTPPLAYTLRYASAGGAATPNGIATVRLPDGLAPLAGTTAYRLGSGIPVAITPSVVGSQLVFSGLPAVRSDSPLTITFSARSGFRLGEGRTASATFTAGAVEQIAFNRAAVSVTENDEPAGNDPATAPVLEPDRIRIGHITTGTDRDFFRTISVNEAGTRIRAYLTPGDADLDLVLYGPSGSTAFEPFRSPASATRVVPVPDNAVQAAGGEPLAAEALDDIPFATLPMVGVSANRETANDYVEAIATVPGIYTLQVSGYNRAVNRTSAYTLRYTLVPPAALPPCAGPRTFAFASAEAGTFPTVLAAGRATLILVNRGRLFDQYGPAASQLFGPTGKLQQLADHPQVGGQVVEVDGSPAVAQAYAAWDASPCSPEAANEVVRAINGAVDALVGGNLLEAGIAHLVLVGTDEATPMARIPDLTQEANERSYASSVAFTGANNALVASFALGYQLSDDPYGDTAPAPYLGRHIHVSDVGIGRLGEDPGAITLAVDNFIRHNGLLNPTTALTVGYDFMEDVASATDAALASVVASADKRTLRTNGWNADQLRSDFTDAADTPDLASVNAHFDHNRLLPAAGTDLLRARSDISDDASLSLERVALWTMGCHSGVSVADVLLTQPGADTSRAKDWAQSFFEKGAATYVGQTGYGVGLKATVALSERVLHDFAKNLASQTMTVGESLLYAKQSYLGGVGIYGVYDEKVLNEATLYGLPMWRIGSGQPGSLPTRSTTVDPITGLQSSIVTSEPAFGGPTVVPGQGSFLDIGGEVLTVNDRPIQPKLAFDVTAPTAGPAKGAIITALESNDLLTGFDPVFARPITDSAAREPEIDSETVLFPASLANLGSYRAPSGERDQLVLVPGQFSATGRNAAGDVIGTQRRYTKVTTQVLYSAAADSVAPAVSYADATKVGSSVTFTVRATDPSPSATGSLTRGVVMAHDETNNIWTRVELSPIAADPDVWTGTATFSGAQVEFFAQMVDGAGNVARTTNKGAFFPAHTAPVLADQPLDIAIGGQQAPAAGWYREPVITVTLPPTVTLGVSVDGGPRQPYGGPFVIGREGVHAIDYLASTGEAGSLVVRVDNSLPSVTSSNHGATYTANSVVPAAYACSDTGSGIESCIGSVALGSNLDTATSGSHTFSVTALDRAGYELVSQVRYDVVPPYSFEGWFQPVDNAPVVNKASGNQTIPLKWALRRPDGTLVTDTATVTRIRSFQIPCSPSQQISLIDEIVLFGAAGVVTWDASAQQFRYNWKTQKAWNGTCRRFEITIQHLGTRTADFTFKA